MIEVEFDVELAWFNDSLHALAAALGKPYAEIVRQNARLIAINLAIQTQPFGLDDRARAQGEAAITRDLGRVYGRPGSGYAEIRGIAASGRQTGEKLAKAYYHALMHGDLEGASRILRSVGICVPVARFDDGAAHRGRRGSRGRVGRGGPSMFVSNPTKLKSYGKKLVSHVGIAKGGWAGGAQSLGGTRGLPRWVNRHKEHGDALDRTSDTNHPHVVLRNRVPWLRSVLTDSQMREALRIQREKMEKRVDAVTTHLAKKHLEGKLAA